MRVAVGGAAGHLAMVLLPMLCNDDEFECVVGIDTAPIHFHHRKLRTIRADHGSGAAATAAREADAIVDLASLPHPRSYRRPGFESDVIRTRTFLGAAGAAGVSRIVFLSSAAVYGAGENLSEAAPLRPPDGCAYARHKAECERWLDVQLPAAVRLRPHIMLGPHAPASLKTLLDAYVYPKLPDPAPLLQCVHELDVAKAVRRALVGARGGAYNLAAQQPFSLPELVHSRHAHAIGLPPGLARAAQWLLWQMRWSAEPVWQGWWERQITLDCRRAQTGLGWRPQFDDWRAIVAATFAPY